MITAELMAEALRQFCPTTNHYRCTDGEQVWYLLITVPSLDSVGTIAELLGIEPLSGVKAHLPKHVDVFLSDENAVVMDADLEPSNGMTALCRIEDCGSHDEALALMGYETRRKQ